MPRLSWDINNAFGLRAANRGSNFTIALMSNATSPPKLQMKEVPGLALVQKKPDRKFKATLQQILRDAKF